MKIFKYKRVKKYSKHPDRVYINQFRFETVCQRVEEKNIKGGKNYPSRVVRKIVSKIITLEGTIGKAVIWEAKIYKGGDGGRGFPFARIWITRNNHGKKPVDGEREKFKKLWFDYCPIKLITRKHFLNVSNILPIGNYNSHLVFICFCTCNWIKGSI